MELPDIIKQAKQVRTAQAKPNQPVPVWGRLFLVRTPKLAQAPAPSPALLTVEASRRAMQYIEDGCVPAWGQAWKRKPGPKSDRPKWEKHFGVKISLGAWATIKKREQRGATIDAACVLDVLHLRGEIRRG